MSNEYPSFNQDAHKLFWELISKYEILYPEFADALNEIIQSIITKNNLQIISAYQFSTKLDKVDKLNLESTINWYFSYLSDIGAREAYENTDEYLYEY